LGVSEKPYAETLPHFHIQSMQTVSVVHYDLWSAARLQDTVDGVGAVGAVEVMDTADAAGAADVIPTNIKRTATDMPISMVCVMAGFVSATPLLWLQTCWWRVCKTTHGTATVGAILRAVAMPPAAVTTFQAVDEAGIAPWRCLATFHGTVCAPRRVDAATAEEVATVQRLAAERSARGGVWLLCQQNCTRAFLHLVGCCVAAVVSMRRCHDLSLQPAHSTVLGAQTAWHTRLSSTSPGVMRLFVVGTMPRRKWQWQVLAVGIPVGVGGALA
jgi:hypothetical protein